MNRKQAASLSDCQSERSTGLRVIAHSLLLSLVCLALIGFIGYIRHSGYFQLRFVHVRGHLTQVDRGAVGSVINESLRGDFFTIHLTQLQKAMANVPWVKRVVIRREWPNALSLTIEGDRAVARWGRSAFLVRSGQVLLGRAGDGVGLPVLSGPVGSSPLVYQMYQYVFHQLSLLHLQVVRLTLNSHGDWRLETQNGMILKLGREHVHERLQRFIKLYPRLSMDRRDVMAQVDLRYRNGVAVRWESYE